MTKGEKRTHVSWRSMVQRCYNPNFKFFKDYDGRGIRICPRWRSFKNFLEDMGPRSRGLTLERVSNDKGYFKENCIFATRRAQALNRRKPQYDHSSPARRGWRTRIGKSLVANWQQAESDD